MKTLDQHHAQMLEANEALKQDVQRDTFLAEWLNEIEEYQPVFLEKTKALTSEARRRLAHEHGFRTWEHFDAAMKTSRKLARDYVHHPAFLSLWSALKEHDRQSGWVDLYGPHNGGVPRQLMDAVVDWYKLPKLTNAERWRLQKKVASLCEELLSSLEQLTPAPIGDDPFSSIRVPTEKAERVMRFLRVPDELLTVPSSRPPWFLSSVLTDALQSAGIDAAWYIRQVRGAASVQPRRGTAPRKINAKSAFRTYLVQQAYALICPYSFTRITGKYRLVADVVEVISGDICTEEDVRKLAIRRSAEDLRE